jgi:hypothetical protein
MYRRYAQAFDGVSEAEYETFIGVLHRVLGNLEA